MARRLRLQFPGAIYHVINRGNYRRDVFETPGAARAFEAALGDACRRFGWQLHAFVVMRNHFHLALTTVRPNLVEGMHWLQTTFAVRFNRYRSENGHLFQGRYQALLVEDADALRRVVDYIHLNPVRAGRVTPGQVDSCPHSSLAAFLSRDRPSCLVAVPWLAALGLEDSSEGWARYLGHLRSSAMPHGQSRESPEARLSEGWAIGTDAWRQAVAREHAHHARELGYAAAEIEEIKGAHWNAELEGEMVRSARTFSEARSAPRGAPWKVAIARHLREQAGVPYAWIAARLHMGSPAAVRVAVCRLRRREGPPA